MKCRWTKARLKYIAWKIDHIKRNQQPGATDGTSLLTQTFAICRENLNDKQFDLAFRALDLIQLAYGQGVARPQEGTRLLSLAVQALKQQQADMASLILYAYRPLLGQNSDQAQASFRQFIFILPLLQKTKHHSLANVIAELIFSYYSSTPNLSESILKSSWPVVRQIGRMALRKNQEPWVRELLCQIFQFLTDYHGKRDDSVIPFLEGLLIELWQDWLYEALQNRSTGNVDLLLAHLESWLEQNWLLEDTFLTLLKNLESTLTLALLQQQAIHCQSILQVCYSAIARKNWLRALKQSGQLSLYLGCLAIEEQQTEELFWILQPFFNLGRKILSREIYWGQGDCIDKFRLQALKCVIDKSLEIADYRLKKDYQLTIAQVVTNWCDEWIQSSLPAQDSAQQFFRFLFIFWQQTRKRQAKGSSKLLSPRWHHWLNAPEEIEQKLIKKLPALY